MAKKLTDDLKAQSDAADLERDPLIRRLRAEITKLTKRIEEHETDENIIVQKVLEAWDEPLQLDIPAPPKQSKKLPTEIPILHLSDVHIGKVTPTYNSAIAAERVALAITKTTEITEIRRSQARIDECRVYLGGDMIEGEVIFGHQAHTIDQHVFGQACKSGPEIFAAAILGLLGTFQRVHCVAVPGNHGRSGSRKSTSHPDTNWDSVLYRVTQEIVKRQAEAAGRGNDITWNVPSDRTESWYAVDRVFGWGNLLIHGHQIRGGFAGFPWYNANRRAWGYIDAIEQSWNYLWMGHFHTMTMTHMNKRTLFANGSTESSNTHAKEEMAAMGYPAQRLVFCNEKYGVISDNPLYLSDEQKPNR